jgi:hypothetical protein
MILDFIRRTLSEEFGIELIVASWHPEGILLPKAQRFLQNDTLGGIGTIT